MSEKSMKFEAAMARLDEIVKEMERGNAPLEDALKLFEEGTKLIQQCSKQLDEAELKIVRLMKGPDGEPVERPMTDEGEE